MIQAPPSFEVACPSCETEFPVDPNKVPPGGVHAICSECQRVFSVEVPEDLVVVAPSGELQREESGSVEEPVGSALPDQEGPPESEADSQVRDSGVEEDVTEAEEAETPSEAPGFAATEAEVPEEEEADTPEVQAPAGSPDPRGSEAATGTAPEVEPESESPDIEPEPASVTKASAQEAPTDADVDASFEDLTTLTSEAMADEDLDEQLAGSALSLAADRFGKRDPGERARRLARVLVSDIIAYYPARYRESLARGTVKEDFEDEVKKSWKEYVDQVGLEVAESTPHFEDALNEILGKGEKIF